MVIFFQSIISFISNPYFMFSVEIATVICKISLIIFFIKNIVKHTPPATPSWASLLVVIICSVMDNIAWIAKLSHDLFGLPSPLMKYTIICISWAAAIIMYHSLVIFIQSFEKRKPPRLRHTFSTILFGMSGIFFSIFIVGIVRALLYSDTSIPFYVLYFLLEHKILAAIAFYNILILIPYAVFEGIVILNTKSMPKILTQQVKACINFFLIPHFIANFWQTYPFNQQTFHPEALVLSEIFLLLAIFYFAKTIIGLRFLNLHSHVHDTREFNFIYDFKTMLEDLGQVTNITEIKILSQQFFNKAFHIDPQKIHLGIITIYHPNEKDFSPRKISTLQSRIETFIVQENFAEYTDESGTTGPIQILIYDEIAYTHFHEPTDFTQRLLTFLDDIDADVFLPMYDQDRIIGYIIINKNKSRKELYTDIERDEMIVFSTYSAKIVNLLQNRNLNELLKERKEILEELYTKHQEITKYKESVQSFLKINKGNSIGIILYKNKTFSFANEDANKILGVNPNTEKGDPAVKILTSLASKIETYKAPQLQFAKNIHNKRFVISGIPHPDNNSVIITLYYPELSDVIEELIDRIKNPSDWDYLLYLETTESGQLINNLIPGNSELLINFKIELLKVALTKKASLINVPENDVISMVELIHHISLKENLHILNLQTPITTQETGITLFGINPLFAISSHNEMLKDPLLEKLNKKGTLFIKNIHFLDLESQINLANFIRYGFYKVLKSERKMFGDVRIICSTNQNLEDLAKQGLFSELLLRELQNTSLTLPTLLTLPTDEIETLIEGFTEQALNSDNATNKLLAFSDKDREQLIAQRPVSLHDLKESIRNLLLMKSKKTDLYEETTFDAAYNISDPKLAEAARLGKYALKDPMMMAMLWNKFHNQNKIATFLGVNRSSVHRRCKDYGIF